MGPAAEQHNNGFPASAVVPPPAAFPTLAGEAPPTNAGTGCSGSLRAPRRPPGDEEREAEGHAFETNAAAAPAEAPAAGSPRDQERLPPTEGSTKDAKRRAGGKQDAARGVPRSDSTADPLVLALSKPVRSYLASIGVTTAAQLLLARTTDLAEGLPSWRRERGMAPLRGRTGALSSVSVWKNKVRRRAAAVGAHGLAGVNAGTNAKIPRKPPP